MRKKMKKQMKKGLLPPGTVLPSGRHGHHMHGQMHGHGGHMQGAGYPAQPGYGVPGNPAYPPQAGVYPTGGPVPPPAGYNAGGFVQPGAAPGGYPAQGYPQPPNPAYPAAPGGYPQQGYPQGGVPPPAGYPSQSSTPGGFVAPPTGGQGGGGFVAPPTGGQSGGGFVAPQPGVGGVPPQPAAGYASGAPYQPGYPGGPPQQHMPPQQHAPPQQPHMQGAAPMGGGVAAATAGMGGMNISGQSGIPRPTVWPANPFNAEQDVNILRTAMKGVGTDERAIIDVISKRSNKQRQEIKVMFKTMLGKDLIQELKSELSGDLEELIMALFQPTTYFDAWSLHQAMSGLGTKEAVLKEILCTRTNMEIKQIVATYKQHYKRDLEKDIASDTSGHFKRLLISCCQGNRQELTYDQLNKVSQQGWRSVVDMNLAQADAQKMYSAGEKKWGTDESAFLQVMALRHDYQLRATIEEYQKISGKSLLSAISSEMSGDLESGFKALVMCAENRPAYFAEKLNHALAGLGTKDSTLIRIVVSRSEIDLQDIKDAYLSRFSKPLASAIASDTSGDYKKLLLAILGA